MIKVPVCESFLGSLHTCRPSCQDQGLGCFCTALYEPGTETTALYEPGTETGFVTCTSLHAACVYLCAPVQERTL